MMKRFRVQGIILYIVIQILLFGSFVILDYINGNVGLSNIFKFTIILLCFIFSIIFGVSDALKRRCCLVLGLLFTLISDYFILLKDWYFIGVVTFIIVQQFYAILLYDKKHLYDKYHKEKGYSYKQLLYHFIRISIQLILTTLVLYFLYIKEISTDRLIGITIFYFINLITNVYTSVHVAWVNRGRSNILFSIGMILFLLCDINVGLYNLNGYISLNGINSILFSFSSILMWIFYAPSQVIISLSALEKIRDFS